MTVLRCSQKLLKRLKQPAKPPDPAPQDNPLGEWSADIFFFDREPLVLALNPPTGACLILPGRAEPLRRLHDHAAQQLIGAIQAFDLFSAGAQREVEAWAEGVTFGRNIDRSAIATLNQRKQDAWHRLAYSDLHPVAVARAVWQTPGKAHGYAFPVELVRARWLPSAQIIPLRRPI